MAYTIGIDVSTTATKAVLLREDGQIMHVAAHPHSVSSPQPLWSEQAPDEWWRAASASIREVFSTGVDPRDIRGIGLTGQMHGLVLLDEVGSVIRPAILWNDQRAAAECDEIRNRVGKSRLIQITGNDAFAGFSLPKLLWVRNNEPEAYGRIRHVLLPKDYIRFRLSAEYASDRAGSGGTLMLDLGTRDWSHELLDLFELPLEWMPATHEGTASTGRVSSEAAAQTGLASGTEVFGGGGDQAASAVGSGILTSGKLSISLGTSGVVFAPTDGPVTAPDGSVHAFPHAIPDTWHVMGVMLAAAGSVEWYRQTFHPEHDYADLFELVSHSEPGADGLLFLPYLSGERTPHADAEARGAFVGLALSHETSHIARSVIEGVSFGLRDNLEMLLSIGITKPESIRVGGGGAKSRVWMQVLADILQTRLESLVTAETAALGCAILAGVGAGVWTDTDEAVAYAVQTGESVTPRSKMAPVYEDGYSAFRSLYPAIKRWQISGVERS